MRKLLLLFLLVAGMSVTGFNQVTVDTTIKLDLLKSPASPAFNILGIALSDVERPTDLNSFTLSLQEASNNFTTIPQSYAFQVAPFLLCKRKFSLNEFDKGKHAFKQSFLISAGFTHMGPEGKEDVDSLKTTKVGLGLKFSIIRPEWSNATRQAYTNLVKAQKELLANFHELENQQEKKDTLIELRKELQHLEENDTLTENEQSRFDELVFEIRRLEEEINETANKNLSSSAAYEKTKKAAMAFKTERQGLFLDFSGGVAFDFPDNRFNNSKVYRGGMWLTGGYENGNKGISSLFIARYLYHPETIFADPGGIIKGGEVSTFDIGGKLLLDISKEKFSFSAEGIYRSILGNSAVDPSWRLVVNAEYDLGVNRKITFAFGRDFDGTISKGGNLVAAINLIAGFGAERKIADKN